MVGGIIILVIILLAVIFITYIMCSEGKKEDAYIPEIKERLLDKNIVASNIKSYLAFKNYEGCLIYTNDNKLYNIVHEGYSIGIKEIEFDKILDVKIDIHYKEKSSMRIISIVPTFDKYQQIVKANIVITTEDEIFDMTLEDGSYRFNTHRIFLEKKKIEWRETINELNKLKLLIEKNMANN